MLTINSELKDEIELASKYELARRSYADYFLLANDFQVELFPHTKLLCDKVQKIVNGEQHFYFIEMPPQHGKSTAISQSLPSYYLMNNPDKEVMIASYSDSLAQKFGRFNLAKFEQFGQPLYNLRIDPKKHTQNEWQIANHKGAMHSTTIFGAATGKHADLLIIDDPIKDQADANSATKRQRILDEWTASFSTRLSADASVIVIMTRWHTDDLIGHLKKERAYPWEEIKLPEIAGKNDPLGRIEGKPLCPFPPISKGLKWAKQQRNNVGNNAWASLYQQSPVQDGGNIFKLENIQYYVPDGETAFNLGLQNDKNTVILPHIEKRWSSWDLTFTASDTSDYTAGQTWGKSGSNFYLLDRINKRMDFNKQIQAILSMHRRQSKANAIYIEDKANGSAVMDTIRNQVSGIIPVVPKGDKVTRANVVVPFFDAQNIYLPHPRWKPWVNDLIDQWVAFPNVPHDDEVDSMTQALSQEINKSGASPVIYDDEDSDIYDTF